jgi:hypothetical protein
VYVGSTVSRTPMLRGRMNMYSFAIGKLSHVPEQGEFALALGAYKCR